jgi:hypothetical protein
MANLAHKKEQRQHIVFREMGLYRIKPAEEIKEIVEEAIYGWTVPAWKAINTQTLDDIYEQIDAKKKVYPKGSDPFVRPLFDEDCYWGVDQIETTVTPRLSQEDVRIRLLEQWQRKHRRH